MGTQLLRNLAKAQHSAELMQQLRFDTALAFDPAILRLTASASKYDLSFGSDFPFIPDEVHPSYRQDSEGHGTGKQYHGARDSLRAVPPIFQGKLLPATRCGFGGHGEKPAK